MSNDPNHITPEWVDGCTAAVEEFVFDISRATDEVLSHLGKQGFSIFHEDRDKIFESLSEQFWSRVKTEYDRLADNCYGPPKIEYLKCDYKPVMKEVVMYEPVRSVRAVAEQLSDELKAGGQ